MTTPKASGAAYNALMEEETKESLVLMLIGLLGDLRRSQLLLDARIWHEEHCSGRFAICTMQRCARARFDMTPSPAERKAGEDFHFEDSQVLAMIQATEYYKDSIAHSISTLTSGEKWSLYRAVVALADAQRASGDDPIVSGLKCGAIYKHQSNAGPHICSKPRGHSGWHKDEDDSFEWKEPRQ